LRRGREYATRGLIRKMTWRPRFPSQRDDTGRRRENGPQSCEVQRPNVRHSMRKWATRRRASVILSLTAISFAVWYLCFVPTYLRGEVAAHVHGTFGYDQVKLTGMVGLPQLEFEREYHRLVWDRYGVWLQE
jgi:hypothetical protein